MAIQNKFAGSCLTVPIIKAKVVNIVASNSNYATQIRKEKRK